METNEMELEELREQIAILRNKLTKSEIISERLLRETMNNKMNYIRRMVRISNWCAVIAILCFLPSFVIGTVSPLFYACTVCLMVVCMICNYITHREIFDPDLFNGSVATVSRAFLRARKLEKTGMVWGLLIGILWICWLSYEMTVNFVGSFSPKHFVGILVFFIVTGGIGFTIGFSMYLKSMRIYNDIISQLEN